MAPRHPPELKAQAREMRKQGTYVAVIAEALGVPEPTIVRWTNPQLEKRERIKARRRKYSKGRNCSKCKKKVSNTSSRLCHDCHMKAMTAERWWTRERIIEAIQVWAAQYGHAPTYDEWKKSGKGHPAVKSISDGPHAPFSKWSEAIEAAGFRPREHRAGARMSRTERQDIRRKMRENRIKKALGKETP
jgi:hypothetical protein